MDELLTAFIACEAIPPIPVVVDEVTDWWRWLEGPSHGRGFSLHNAYAFQFTTENGRVLLRYKSRMRDEHWVPQQGLDYLPGQISLTPPPIVPKFPLPIPDFEKMVEVLSNRLNDVKPWWQALITSAREEQKAQCQTCLALRTCQQTLGKRKKDSKTQAKEKRDMSKTKDAEFDKHYRSGVCPSYIPSKSSFLVLNFNEQKLPAVTNEEQAGAEKKLTSYAVPYWRDIIPLVHVRGKLPAAVSQRKQHIKLRQNVALLSDDPKEPFWLGRAIEFTTLRTRIHWYGKQKNRKYLPLYLENKQPHVDELLLSTVTFVHWGFELTKTSNLAAADLDAILLCPSLPGKFVKGESRSEKKKRLQPETESQPKSKVRKTKTKAK